MTYDYESLKRLAKTLRRGLNTLHALSGDNDPFMANMPFRREAGDWFARIWRELDTEESQFHIRRIHYRLIPSTFLCPNGEPYANTENCWKMLCEAGRDARYLDLVPPGVIIDRRNPEPAIYLIDATASDATITASAEFLAIVGRRPRTA
jgi:hypothetical protein